MKKSSRAGRQLLAVGRKSFIVRQLSSIMDKNVLEKYLKAGKIAKEAKKLAASLIKPGALLLDIAEKVDGLILMSGAGLSFPTDISLNEIAAHYSPIVGDKTKLKAGDLVKVDLGAHVDGYVVDTAVSFSVGKNKENELLIKAATEALNAGIKVVKPGASTGEIGRKVEQVISGYGLQSIRNLRGHGVARWEIHTDPSIPNYYVENSPTLKEGNIITIEPFPTTGEGLVVEGKGSEVYAIVSKGQIRQAREVLEWLQKEYKTLPFAKRTIADKFGLLKTNLAVKQMLLKGIITEYPLLREKRNGKVAQMEHTMIVEKSGARVIT